MDVKVSVSVPVSDGLNDIQPWLDQNPGSQQVRRSFVKFCPLMGLTVAPDPIWLHSYFICVPVFPQLQHHRMTFSNQSSTRKEKMLESMTGRSTSVFLTRIRNPSGLLCNPQLSSPLALMLSSVSHVFSPASTCVC